MISVIDFATSDDQRRHKVNSAFPYCHQQRRVPVSVLNVDVGV